MPIAALTETFRLAGVPAFEIAFGLGPAVGFGAGVAAAGAPFEIDVGLVGPAVGFGVGVAAAGALLPDT